MNDCLRPQRMTMTRRSMHTQTFSASGPRVQNNLSSSAARVNPVGSVVRGISVLGRKLSLPWNMLVYIHQIQQLFSGLHWVEPFHAGVNPPRSCFLTCGSQTSHRYTGFRNL